MKYVCTRLFALIVKELLTLFRDTKVRIILIAPPIMQLFIFSFAATLEVSNVSVAIYNQDLGRHGSEIIHRISASPTFINIFFVKNHKAYHALIDEQKAIATIHIPQDFSRNIEAGDPASFQVILDGRRSNAAQIVNSYIINLANQYTESIGSSHGSSSPLIIERNWYNPNLLYMWFTVPALVGILAMLITLMVTALSVAREKELGTFDQLLVSPLMPHEILIGKAVPAVLVGIGEAVLILCISILIFKIPFQGSFWLFIAALAAFVFSLVGVGLFISSLAKTQQQAILGAFTFMVPAVTLSGFAAPIENMPSWLQTATLLNPLRHGIRLFKGIYLKDLAGYLVWESLWPLIIISVITLTLAAWFFRKRLE